MNHAKLKGILDLAHDSNGKELVICYTGNSNKKNEPSFIQMKGDMVPTMNVKNTLRNLLTQQTKNKKNLEELRESARECQTYFVEDGVINNVDLSSSDTEFSLDGLELKNPEQYSQEQIDLIFSIADGMCVAFAELLGVNCRRIEEKIEEENQTA